MLYLNQLEYRDIPYQHNMAHGGAPEDRRNVATSGCGLCSAWMIVDGLTDKKLGLEECVRLSEDNGANLSLGTDLSVLGPVIADRFGLVYSHTDSLTDAVEALRDGGQVIAHVSHPEGMTGLFTMRGHYILLTSTDGKDFCILDPSYTEGKFDIPERVGRVNVANAPYLYCDVNTVHAETKSKRYHVFTRKKI